MQKYKKNYLKAYWLDETDFIICENCWKQAVDIHHIIYRSRWGSDEAENLIALCRDCHDRSHFKKKPYLSTSELFKKKKIK